MRQNKIQLKKQKVKVNHETNGNIRARQSQLLGARSKRATDTINKTTEPINGSQDKGKLLEQFLVNKDLGIVESNFGKIRVRTAFHTTYSESPT